LVKEDEKVSKTTDKVFVRMSLKQLEEMKKRILMYVVRSRLPVTPTSLCDELPVCYPTALSLLMELTLEGHLELINRNGNRYFKAVPDKTLTVINQKE
jgi:ribosomal protein S25